MGQFRHACDKVLFTAKLLAVGARPSVLYPADFNAAHMIAAFATLPGFLIFDVERQSIRTPINDFHNVETGGSHFRGYLSRDGVLVKSPGCAP